LSQIESNVGAGGIDRLIAMIPALVGLLVFAALDHLFSMGDGMRLAVIVVLTFPGFVWALYIGFCEIRAFLGWHRRERARERGETE
jgi:hypothetical protein